MKLSPSLTAKLEALRLQELESGSVADAQDLEALLELDEIVDDPTDHIDAAWERGYDAGIEDHECEPCERDHV